MEKEKLDMVCIGYKTAFTGEKMYHYKLNRDGKEYLIVDANMIRLLDMKWTEDNDFGKSDLWDDFERPITEIEKAVKAAVKSTEKKDYELGEEEEKNFFTQHEVLEKVPEPIPARTIGTLSSSEVDDLMDMIDENAPEDDEFFTITKDMLTEAEAEFMELEGYQAKRTQDGYHKNDGQMVEYTFTLKSPSGKITKISTEMCLMVGWNNHESLTIN